LEALSGCSAKHQKCSGDVSSLFKDPEPPVIDEPQDPPDSEKSKFKLRSWEKAVDSHCKRVDTLADNLKALCAVTWGQCSEAMRAKIMTIDDCETQNNDSNVSWLLKEIRGIACSFENQRHLFLALDKARTDFQTFRQGGEVPLADCLQSFRTKLAILEHCGGGPALGQDPALLKLIKKRHPRCSDDAVKSASSRHAQGLALLARADKKRCGGPLADLENQCARGNDQHPTDLTSACALLVAHRAPPSNSRQPSQPRQPNPDNDTVGMTFTQTSSSPAPGTDGILHAGKTCCSCSTMGHCASACPSSSTTTGGLQLLQIGGTSEFTFAQSRLVDIPRA